MLIVWLIKKKLWKRPAEAVLYLFLAAAVPLSMGSIIIMAPDASVSMLMLYQYVILYVFLVAMLERSLREKDGLFSHTAPGASGRERTAEGKMGLMRRAKESAFSRLPGFLSLFVTAVLLLVGYENFLVTNEAYFRMDIAYERAYAWYNRIMERLETTEGYQPGDAYLVLGEYGLSDTPDLLGSLIAAGIMGHILIQVILNIAVVTNTIPNTGITLPFVSYGGTSVLFLLSEMGLALNVSRSVRQEP